MAGSTNGRRRRRTTKASTTPRKPPRRKKEPTLTPDQAREVFSFVAGLVGFLCFAAVIGQNATPGLHGFAAALFDAFGYGWFMPAGFLVALGVAGVWPRDKDGLLRGVGVRGSTLRSSVLGWIGASLTLMGFISLFAARNGGATGQVVDWPSRWIGSVIEGIVLFLLLFFCVVLTLRGSFGTTLLYVVEGARAAHRNRPKVDPVVGRHAARLWARMQTKPPEAAAESEPRPPATTAAGADVASPAAAVEPIVVQGQADLPLEDAEQQALARAEQHMADDDEEDEAVLRIRGEWEAPVVQWRSPTFALLEAPASAKLAALQDETKRNVRIIEGTLDTFNIKARVIAVNSGPAVTVYELQPAAGVKISKVLSYQHDLAMALAAAPLRIEAPIPGKSAIGIEVPNKTAQVVGIRQVVAASDFVSPNLVLGVALGHDTDGTSRIADLNGMPHVLIAGATGQGKSVCINAFICSLLLRHAPEHVRFLMIDPKRVELQQFEGLPHLVWPVIVESPQAVAALRWAVNEMERRYKVLAREGVRNIGLYNAKATARRARPLPYVVIVIDELADLMMVAAGEIEELVCRIAQLARAVGIHLVIATQRPSTDIITGLIKANMPTRIAFAVGSHVDSKVILDQVGAEKLLGRGDMLYLPVNATRPSRLQGAFISDREVEALVKFWRDQGSPAYVEEVLSDAELMRSANGGGAVQSDRRLDPLFARAARAVAAEGAASVSLVQRKFNVGYSRAGRIIDQLSEHRVVGSYQGSKSREVLMNLPDVDELLAQLGVEGQ